MTTGRKGSRRNRRLGLKLLALAAVLVVCLVGCTHHGPGGGVSTGASPWNDVLAPSRLDIDWRQTPTDPVALEPAWELALPWSRDGLGGGDRYLGVGEEGMPLGGGATPPEGFW